MKGDRLDHFFSNRVIAIEVPMVLMGKGRFHKGDWVRLAGRELYRVWGYRGDADVIYLY